MTDLSLRCPKKFSQLNDGLTSKPSASLMGHSITNGTKYPKETSMCVSGHVKLLATYKVASARSR